MRTLFNYLRNQRANLLEFCQAETLALKEALDEEDSPLNTTANSTLVSQDLAQLNSIQLLDFLGQLLAARHPSPELTPPPPRDAKPALTVVAGFGMAALGLVFPPLALAGAGVAGVAGWRMLRGSQQADATNPTPASSVIIEEVKEKEATENEKPISAAEVSQPEAEEPKLNDSNSVEIKKEEEKKEEEEAGIEVLPSQQTELQASLSLLAGLPRSPHLAAFQAAVSGPPDCCRLEPEQVGAAASAIRVLIKEHQDAANAVLATRPNPEVAAAFSGLRGQREDGPDLEQLLQLSRSLLEMKRLLEELKRTN